MSTDVDKVLAERGRRYGDFRDHAEVSQSLKEIVYSPKYRLSTENLPAYLVEGLDMILHKIARVVTGDPLYEDNFVDIAGYAKLVADRLVQDNEQNK